jgi:phenylalanyl-tRNA synthetase alpha chain
MYEDLTQLKEAALGDLAAAQHAEALEAWRVRYLGRKGALSEAMKRLGALAREERPAYGQAANEVKDALEAAFTVREEQVKHAALAAELTAGAVDVTLPGRPPELGYLHVVTQTLREFYAIFAEMGFQVYLAPDVETDEYNFGLLNIPPYHPARDMWDTFWVNDQVVLRTHTSPGQIRAMRERAPEPIRVILPGKCYRYEQISARSEQQFYQVEGLAVGRGIRLTDLIGTLQQFARQMYGPSRRLRVRGSYFPFTEPSIEADMDCILLAGSGRRRHGAPAGVAQRRLRPGGLLGIRLRPGGGAPGAAQARHQRHPLLLRQRSALPEPVRMMPKLSPIRERHGQPATYADTP